MLQGRKLAVVVPAFNEAGVISTMLHSIPAFIDQVIVVDDASTDGTAEAATRVSRRGLEVVRHANNRGVGAAIATGYRRALVSHADIAIVMAGDGQMHPDDLFGLVAPLLRDRADYVKGNRFASPHVLFAMPVMRLIGNVVLSLATKLTSGYPKLFDSQCGYTAASRRALEIIDAEGLFPRYGYPNDLLARLHAADMRVLDAPVRAVYGPAWRSGIRPWTVVYPMSFVLARSWARRIRIERAQRRGHAQQPVGATTANACASAS